MSLRSLPLIAAVIFAISIAIYLPVQAAEEWGTVYDGHGRVSRSVDHSFTLNPHPSTQKEETHAALVLATKTQKKGLKDFKISITYRIKKQLRQPASEVNPWETLWIFFNYQAVGKQKKTNYFIVKPNGLEIGKAWGEKEQAFIYTSPQPRLKQKDWQDLTLVRKGNQFTVQLNQESPRQVDIPDSKGLFQDPGAIGLYTEDAEVEIKTVQVDEI